MVLLGGQGESNQNGNSPFTARPRQLGWLDDVWSTLILQCENMTQSNQGTLTNIFKRGTLTNKDHICENLTTWLYTFPNR